MPLDKYNAQFGGKPGAAAKAKSAMMDSYGADKGESVFYATKNKRKSQGNGNGGSKPKSRSRGGMGIGMQNGTQQSGNPY